MFTSSSSLQLAGYIQMMRTVLSLPTVNSVPFLTCGTHGADVNLSMVCGHPLKLGIITSRNLYISTF